MTLFDLKKQNIQIAVAIGLLTPSQGFEQWKKVNEDERKSKPILTFKPSGGKA